ncbi:MAG: hypothetical protein AAFU85_11180 [Planctomycetota bacterium]
MTEHASINDDRSWQWSNHFQESIKLESTRAKVILSGCYLDELLRKLLAINLAPSSNKEDSLFDGARAPLGTFSAKIDIAHRMKLIPDATLKSLHDVRKIRNSFAHDIAGCDFKKQQILDWTSNLVALNPVIKPETRARFSDGPLGDFESSVAWNIFWLKDLIDRAPTECSKCGGTVTHREKIKAKNP